MEMAESSKQTLQIPPEPIEAIPNSSSNLRSPYPQAHSPEDPVERQQLMGVRLDQRRW